MTKTVKLKNNSLIVTMAKGTRDELFSLVDEIKKEIELKEIICQ